jgi:hypothetical protein
VPFRAGYGRLFQRALREHGLTSKMVEQRDQVAHIGVWDQWTAVLCGQVPVVAKLRYTCLLERDLPMCSIALLRHALVLGPDVWESLVALSPHPVRKVIAALEELAPDVPSELFDAARAEILVVDATGLPPISAKRRSPWE